MIRFLINIINDFSCILSPIFYKLIYMSIISTFTGIIVLVTRTILKNKISPNWISRIWIVFIITLILPISVSTKLSIYNYLPQDILISNNNFEQIQNTSYKKQVIQLEKGENINVSQNEENQIRLKSVVFDYILPYTWLIVVNILLIIYFVTYYKFSKNICKKTCIDERINDIFSKAKNELKIKKDIKLIVQEKVKTPCIFGILNPKVLITEELNNMEGKQLEYVFLHELAHYKRRDNIIVILISIIRYLYIFNPFIWFMLNQMKKDIEIETDYIAIKELTSNEQTDYAKTLLQLSIDKKENMVVRSLCMSDIKNNLKKRIIMINKNERFRKHRLVISFISILLIILMILVFCTSKVTDNVEKIDMETLKIYENTNLMDIDTINKIIRELCYSKYIEDVSSEYIVSPYELDIKYNTNKRGKNLEYNSIIIFSLIPQVEEIKYIFNDVEEIVKREEQNTETDINNIFEYINKDNIFGDDIAYNLTINKNGVKCFEDSSLAWKKFKQDYKDEIESIRKEYNLLPLSKWTYKDYENFSVNMNSSDEEKNNRYKNVNLFFNIYEDGYYTYKVNDKYEIKDVEIDIKNVDNNVQDLKIVANLLLQKYFSSFYGEDVMDEQRISACVILKSDILAGDKDEFVAKLEYGINTDRVNENKESAWGEENLNNKVIDNVMIRITKIGEERGEDNRDIITKYKLKEIGDDLDYSDLEQLDITIPIRNY